MKSTKYLIALSLLALILSAIVVIGVRDPKEQKKGSPFKSDYGKFPKLIIVIDDSFSNLHLAAFYGFNNFAKLLIHYGYDVDIREKKGFTPLHIAANRGKIDMAKLLLNNGADVNAKAKEGDTPLYGAVWGGHSEMVELLISKGGDVNENRHALRYQNRG